MRREVISNVSCAGANCTCDWSIKVGTTTQTNSSVQSYSSIKIARLVLWNYVLNNQAIVQLANEMQGNSFPVVKRLIQWRKVNFSKPKASFIKHWIARKGEVYTTGLGCRTFLARLSWSQLKSATKTKVVDENREKVQGTVNKTPYISYSCFLQPGQRPNSFQGSL